MIELQENLGHVWAWFRDNSAVVVAAATIVYAFLTYKILKATRRHNRPYLYIGLEKWSFTDEREKDRNRHFFIRNAGNRAAYNIRFRVIKDDSCMITYPAEGDKGLIDEDGNFSNSYILREGIVVLPPEEVRILEDVWIPSLLMTFKPTKKVVDCRVTYEDGDDKFTQRLAIQYYF